MKYTDLSETLLGNLLKSQKTPDENVRRYLQNASRDFEKNAERGISFGLGDNLSFRWESPSDDKKPSVGGNTQGRKLVDSVHGKRVLSHSYVRKYQESPFRRIWEDTSLVLEFSLNFKHFYSFNHAILFDDGTSLFVKFEIKSIFPRQDDVKFGNKKGSVGNVLKVRGRDFLSGIKWSEERFQWSGIRGIEFESWLPDDVSISLYFSFFGKEDTYKFIHNKSSLTAHDKMILKTLKECLTESKKTDWNPKDPVGLPDFVVQSMSAHEKMSYKKDMLPHWNRLNLPEGFEERVKALGGVVDKVKWGQGYTFIRQTADKRNREDLPSEEMWNTFGNFQKSFQMFTKGGKRHRDGGKPAYTEWNPDGSVNISVMYENGKKVKSKEPQISILKESKETLDPAGMPDVVFKKLPAHTQIRYKMLWKKMNLSDNFKERVHEMGGYVLEKESFGDIGYHFPNQWRERYIEGFPEMKLWYNNGQQAFQRTMFDYSFHSKDGKPSFLAWDKSGQEQTKIWHKNGQEIKRWDKK